MELITSKSKKKVSTNVLLGMLFILMLGDYMLTYLGMYSFGVIDEANYLMVWLMGMPFEKGFIVRVFVTLVPVLLLKFAEKYKEPMVYKQILLIPLGIQVVPYIAHGIWVFKYILMLDLNNSIL